MENSTNVKGGRKIPIVELVYRHPSQLLDLLKEEEFTLNTLKESYDGVKYAIENELSKVDLFDLQNLSLTVRMRKSQYPKVLKKVLPYFEAVEDYSECAYIQRILKPKRSWFGRQL